MFFDIFGWPSEDAVTYVKCIVMNMVNKESFFFPRPTFPA